MPSTSETGHVINVANFNDLIAAAQSIGAKYAPTNTALKVASLQALAITAKKMNDDVKMKKNALSVAINSRAAEFSDLKPLATRVANAFASALPNDPAAIADLRAINKQIQGGRKKAADPASLTQKTISTSQQSYDQQKDHFKSMIAFLQQYPAYAPNETDLQVSALQARVADMDAAELVYSPAHKAYSDALVARDKALYEPIKGLVDTAKSVKTYVKSVYDAKAPEFKNLNKIAFKTIKPGK